MAKRNVLSVSSGSLECDLACEIVGDTGGKDIYIGDSTYTLYVTIRNEGSTSYRLTGKQPDGTTNAHFELNFSAHILLAGEYDNETYPQSASADWAVTYQTVSGTDYITNLFLFYVGQTPLNLPPNGTLVVPIQYRTDTESDAETCRITVKPGDDPALWSPLPGCAAGMQVTEDVTAYTYQLTAFVVGGDTLLNDGATANRFTLRLLNPTTTPILLQPNTTAFEISIDTGSDATGLCTADQARQISVTTTAQGFNAPTYPQGNNVPRSVWTVRTANQNTPIVIPAAGSVDFTFANVKTALAPGRSMVYVRCASIPSMGGQVLIASVEKSPAFPAQGTQTNIKAAQLLYAPGTVGSGGSGLLIKGAAQSSGSLNLLQIDGTNGHTGLSISNIGGSAHGLSVRGNTSSPVGQFTQDSTTNYSLRADGGWGVGIYNVTNQSSGLYVELSSINAGVKVQQNSTGNSAIFYGGAGVSIETITGNNRGLNIAANSTGDGLKVSQQGAANSAYFTGGRGVKIDGVTSANSLNINTNASSDAMYINQQGEGSGINVYATSLNGQAISATHMNASGTAAKFRGKVEVDVGGINIDSITSGNALHINAATSSNALHVNQTGTGHALKIETSSTNQALYVSQSNTSGMAAKFSGKVEIDGDLVVKGGSIILQSDAGSTAYQITLRTGQAPISNQGATLFVQTSSAGPANIQVWQAYVSDHIYWGANQEAKVYYDGDGGSKGLYMDQPSGQPRGHIQGDGS